VGPPTILQSDNGKEFTATIILNLMSLWPNVKIINGRPRHPQSQGSVERGNGILARKLGALMEQNDSIEWVIALRLTLWGMNNSICRATGKTPYELVYGQKPKNNNVWLDILFEQNNNVLNEDDLLNIVEVEQETNDLNNIHEVCFIIFFKFKRLSYFINNLYIIINRKNKNQKMK
jgi:hypothetical protein